MRRKRILIVHNVENIRSARRSTMDYIYAFERYAPEHDYVYHRIQLPVTQVLRETAWDAVIFDSTSLGVVTIRPRERFHRLREEWAFLRDYAAMKIAFPQDDASHSALYDYWLHWMRVDAVFTVRPEKIDRLYPLTRRRAAFASAVAGYIDDASLDSLAALSRPWANRDIVLGQRVTRYPAWGGRFAQRKSDIVFRLGEECARRGLKIDISTQPQDVLHGEDWYRFLGNCQFVAGAEGGHGLCDPYGAIQDAVNDYVARHPDASFEDIEQSCFEGLDGQELFPGFAPRVLEAALMGCGQVLLEGRYRDFIRPGDHYIEVKDDYSNLDDVFAQMANPDLIARMVANCSRDLVQNPAFRFSTLVADVIARVDAHGHRTDSRPAADRACGDIRRRHFDQMRDALTIIGIERERLYEPYLGAWVMRELSGQLRHVDEAQDFGIVLPEDERPATVASISAVAEKALEHVNTVVSSLPPNREAVLPLIAAVASGPGKGLTFERDEIRSILASLGIASDLKTLANLSDVEPADMVGVARQFGWPQQVVDVLDTCVSMHTQNDAPDERMLLRAMLTKLGRDPEQVIALAELGSPLNQDPLAVARALKWPEPLTAVLSAALAILDQADQTDARIHLRTVLTTLGMDPHDLGSLLTLSSNQHDDPPAIAAALGWQAQVVEILRILSGTPPTLPEQARRNSTRQILSVLGIDTENLKELIDLSSIVPENPSAVAGALPWPSRLQSAISTIQKAGLEEAHQNSAYLLRMLHLLAADKLPARIIRLLADRAKLSH